MSPEGARHSTSTKPPEGKFCPLCTPTLSLNPTLPLMPIPTLSLVLPLHLSRPLALTLTPTLALQPPGSAEGLGIDPLSRGSLASPRTAGELICVYSGTVLTLVQLMHTADRDYVMGGFGLNAHVDARDHPHVLARYINDNFAPGARNARFVKLRQHRRALVVALRDIAAGEELFVDYGEVHWKNRAPQQPQGILRAGDCDPARACALF